MATLVAWEATAVGVDVDARRPTVLSGSVPSVLAVTETVSQPWSAQRKGDEVRSTAHKVAAGAPTRLVTRRLTLHRASQAEAPALAVVFASNSEFLRTSWACHQTFDAAEAARHLEMESQRENGLCLSIVERATHRVIGLAVLQVPNPVDSVPWIGLLIVAADRQDEGFGSEAAWALERLLARQGWPEVRLNVLVANPRARRFWERLGYRELQGAWRAYNGQRQATVTLGKLLAERQRKHGSPQPRRMRDCSGLFVPSGPVKRGRRPLRLRS